MADRIRGTIRWRPSTRRKRQLPQKALMSRRVQRILLLASAYDSFILEEDGQFSDRVSGEFIELKISGAPDFHRVPTAGEALELLEQQEVDLLLTTGHFADMTVIQMAERVKDVQPGLPVAFLSFDKRQAHEVAMAQHAAIDLVFLWSGDPRILLAVVKLVEDQMNVAEDTDAGDVRVILVVEDSPSFYSAYLPIIYTEVMEQTRRLMAERLHEADRIARMRARPKILLASTLEEAEDLLERYADYMLGVITDMRFPGRGQLNPKAGLELIQQVREHDPTLPILLQSAETEHASCAEQQRVVFANKNSPDLLGLLRRFMSGYLGFGPFVFRDAHGTELMRATTIREMLDCLERIPGEALDHHARNNDFSNWFKARSEFNLASELRPRQATDFGSIEGMRRYLITLLGDFLEREQRGQITEFDREVGFLSRDFTRIGGGSLGGKARGIGFLGLMLAESGLAERFDDIRIFVPRTLVLCTDLFDRFVDRSRLRERAMACEDDEEIRRMFLAASMPRELVEDLARLLDEVHYPLAVRSSSLLEDAHFQPFAGVYSTFLIPNNHTDHLRRLELLSQAIKLIYASVFTQGARAYMEATSQRHEEEKMAVVIQRLVGTEHEDRFYPDFAGVARSRNYYPPERLRPEDGIVSVALGLGRTVVGGGACLHFSPVEPRVPLHMATPDQALKYSQRRFYALDLTSSDRDISGDEGVTLAQHELETAERDGTLHAVGGTFVPQNERIYDSLSREGTRIVNFAGVLRHGRFPLAACLRELLSLAEAGIGTDVELEFAVCMEGRKGKPELAVVQVRPMATDNLGREVLCEPCRPGERMFLRGRALGGGILEGIQDIVYVSPERYDRTETPAIARTIAEINRVLAEEGRASLLISPGRWGSSDRFLGVPVNWPDISSARALVELSFPGYAVDPSQGSHFFHNINALRFGYFAIDTSKADELLDLDWLESLPALHDDGVVRHVRIAEPVEIRIDTPSRTGVGVVLQRRRGASKP